MSPRARNRGRWGQWTDERILAAITDAARFLGRRPGQVDFDPSHARRLGHHDRAQIAEEMIEAGDWPSHHTIADHFGSFNAALAELGYEPRGRGSRGQDADAYVPEGSL